MTNLNLDQIIQFLLRIQFWDVVKALLCFALFLYVLVALVVFKQVKMMVEVIDGQMNPVINGIALIHFLGAILVFLIALVIL
jgi:hypothetical protein